MAQSAAPAQAAVLEPPYNNRLDRPFLRGLTASTGAAETPPDQIDAAASAAATGDIEVSALGRTGFKKDFDKKIFGTDYF